MANDLGTIAEKDWETFILCVNETNDVLFACYFE